MINFDSLILDFNDQPIHQPENNGAVTLELVSVSALVAQLPDENPSGKEKFDRFTLAIKCKGEVELKVEEIALIKDRIGKVSSALVVGRSWQLLDKAVGRD